MHEKGSIVKGGSKDRTLKLIAGYPSGLNPQQVRIIANATPKREYYYQSTSGNRLFELGLGGVSLAAVGSSSPGSSSSWRRVNRRR
mgnify:CR=1 FL=1